MLVAIASFVATAWVFRPAFIVLCWNLHRSYRSGWTGALLISRSGPPIGSGPLLLSTAFSRRSQSLPFPNRVERKRGRMSVPRLTFALSLDCPRYRDGLSAEKPNKRKLGFKKDVNETACPSFRTNRWRGTVASYSDLTGRLPKWQQASSSLLPACCCCCYRCGDRDLGRGLVGNPFAVVPDHRVGVLKLIPHETV